MTRCLGTCGGAIRAFILALCAIFSLTAEVSAQASPPSAMLDQHWSGARAMKDIAEQLRFTPRSIGAPGHAKTIDYISSELAKIHVGVETQRFSDSAGSEGHLDLTNVVARISPLNLHRIIVATHYDSIVRAYRDPKTPEAPMPGANNSASGVAVLLETARALSSLPAPPVGVDLVFFDGEEGPKSLGAGDPQWRALGSPYFADHLNEFYPDQKPEAGVVFDMVCYRDLRLKPEVSSLATARAQVEKFWNIGAQVAPTIFVQTPTIGPIGDDQVALTAAGIPSFLVIDFEYEPWFNTSMDTLDKCSAGSLDAVGHTLLRFLYQ
jgi:glutaminyl-peptide cyclotransferase